MIYVFAWIGFVCALATIYLLGLALYGALRTWIEQMITKYRIKHRFDKPPTAKCYCVDCTRHDNETGRCYRFEYASGYQCTADDWFCWDATPRKEVSV